MWNQFLDFLSLLLDPVGFPARWYCGVWSQSLGWVHIISDLLTAVAYCCMSGLIIYYSIRKKLNEYKLCAWLFASFILSCGIDHLFEAYIFWNPIYRFLGLIKIVTTIAAWTAVLYLIKKLPVLLDIPERLVAEKLFTQVFEKLPAAALLLDKNFFILQVNQATKNYFDLEEESLIGRAVKDLFTEDSQSSLTTFLAGGHSNREILARISMGNVHAQRPVIAHLQPLTAIEKGKYLLTLDDMPELAEARIATMQRQEELEEVAAYKHAILEHMHDGVIVIDEIGYIKTINPKAREIIGFENTPPQGLLLSEVLASLLNLTLEQSGKIITDLLNNKQNVQLSYSKGFCINLPLVNPRTVEIIVSDMIIGNKKNYCLILHDITERTLYEEQLRTTQELIDQATNNVDSLLWIARMDDQGIIYCTKSYTKVFGRPYEELMADNLSWLNVVHPDDREKIREKFYFQNGFSPWQMIFRVIKPCGEIRYLDSRGFEVTLGGNGIVTHMAGITIDVTDLCLTQQELSKKCEESDIFNHILAHDLKQPIYAIKNLAKWIDEDWPNDYPQESREHLRLLQTRIGRLESLLEGIFNYFFKTDTNIVEERIYWPQMLEEITFSIGLTKDIKLIDNTNLQEVTTKKMLLQQTLTNLISNAIKHHHNPAHIEIQIHLKKEGNDYIFEVSDNGPGIPLQFFDHIFKPLTTLKSKDVVEGSGLGLAIVKKIVTQQEGRIWIESQEGHGTTFLFTWPLSECKLNKESF